MPRLAVLSVLSAASSPCPDLNLIHYIRKFLMKYMIALLLAASPVLASAAPNNDKAAVQAVIARYYNHPLAAENCQLAKLPKDSNQMSDVMYCMKPIADHTVTRNGTPKRLANALWPRLHYRPDAGK